MLVRTTVPDAMLASSASVMIASVSAIATAVPFSLNVAVHPVPAPEASRSSVGAMSVTVPLTVATELPPLASATV